MEYKMKSCTHETGQISAPSPWYLFLSCSTLESIAGKRRLREDVDRANRSFSFPIPPLEVEGDGFSTTPSKRFLLSEPSRNCDPSPPPLTLLPPRPSVPRAELRSLDMSFDTSSLSARPWHTNAHTSSLYPPRLHPHTSLNYLRTSQNSLWIHASHSPFSLQPKLPPPLRLLQNPIIDYRVASPPPPPPPLLMRSTLSPACFPPYFPPNCSQSPKPPKRRSK
jgi:hypothetical protein